MQIFANVNKNPKLKIVTKSGEILLIEATSDKQESDFSKQELPSTKGSMIIYTHDQEPEVFINKLYDYLSQQIEELKNKAFPLENILYFRQ